MINDLEFWRLDSVEKAKSVAEDIDRLVIRARAAELSISAYILEIAASEAGRDYRTTASAWIDRNWRMNRLLVMLILGGVPCGALADQLDFSPTAGKRLKTEVSSSGVPSVNEKTWTATCSRGIAISGFCESQSGQRTLQNVGIVAGTQWACTWTEPTPKAEVTALCLFEE
jgi:hypothetical protein